MDSNLINRAFIKLAGSMTKAMDIVDALIRSGRYIPNELAETQMRAAASLGRRGQHYSVITSDTPGLSNQLKELLSVLEFEASQELAGTNTLNSLIKSQELAKILADIKAHPEKARMYRELAKRVRPPIDTTYKV